MILVCVPSLLLWKRLVETLLEDKHFGFLLMVLRKRAACLVVSVSLRFRRNSTSTSGSPLLPLHKRCHGNRHLIRAQEFLVSLSV